MCNYLIIFEEFNHLSDLEILRFSRSLFLPQFYIYIQDESGAIYLIDTIFKNRKEFYFIYVIASQFSTLNQSSFYEISFITVTTTLDRLWLASSPGQTSCGPTTMKLAKAHWLPLVPMLPRRKWPPTNRRNGWTRGSESYLLAVRWAKPLWTLLCALRGNRK